MKKNFVVALALFAATTLLFGVTQAEAQSAEDNPAEVEAGQTVFTASCAGCHGEDGMGSSRGRPLIGVASENDRSVHFASVSGGKGGMPAFGEQLSVEQIDAALSYVRLTFVADGAAADDDATSDEAASDDQLANTGAETPLVALGGITLLAAGVLVLHTARRQD